MLSLSLVVTSAILLSGSDLPLNRPYCVVDTGQTDCYDNYRRLAQKPKPGEPFFGQDAQNPRHPMSYQLSDDGLTVYDRNTGLTWQRSPDQNHDGQLNRKDKLVFSQAIALPRQLNASKFGGYSDWRLPSIKELYSLINFNGEDPSGMNVSTDSLTPFIDRRFFKFAYGSASDGERVIDSQYASATVYVRKGIQGAQRVFGVNFADGRIKGYDSLMPGGRQKDFYVMCVRGNPKYGVNDLQDNGDQTVTDRATGLMWTKEDSKKAMNWQDALQWAQEQNRANYLGHHDWRLPNVKELQSIVDYTKSPAIYSIFNFTKCQIEGGYHDAPWYWSSTTHGIGGRAACYVCFGVGTGYMGAWLDVHGAGAQRSDPKTGDPSQFPYGRGPQGDGIRILNFVRLVRDCSDSSNK